MKRIIALVLCVILCLSLIPLAALADDAGNPAPSSETVQPEPAETDSEGTQPSQPDNDGADDTDFEEPSGETENDEAQGDSAFSGSGTKDEPYRIGTEQELAALAELVNSGVEAYAGASYVLTDDIFLSSVCSPIGTAGQPFGGCFDGCGHKVFSLCGSGNGSVFGLFGVTYGAVIEKLGLEYADISGSYERVGAIVGIMHGGRIGECYVTGSVINAAEDSYVGGLVGECDGAVIENCYNCADIKGYSVVGGVVGMAGGGSSVSCCYGSGKTESTCWDMREGYVIGDADDSVTYSGIRAINGTDYRGYTLRDEHLASPEYFEGYDFENIWKISWYGAPVLISSTEAKPLTCLAPSFASVKNASSEDYNALVIGQENYPDIWGRRPGKITADIVAETLTQSDEPWDIQLEYNLPIADMSNTFNSVFGSSTSDSVNFFFYCGHGYNASPSVLGAGSISDTDKNLMPPSQLASLLNSYAGHFIVILDSCGSGGVIDSNLSANSALANYSNQAVIDAFDTVNQLNYVPNAGPMRTSKFSVITACAIDEVSYSQIFEDPPRSGNPIITDDDKELGYFCLGYWFSECAGLSTEFVQTGIVTEPAALDGDADKNGTLTVSEAFSYLSDRSDLEYAKFQGVTPPNVQVWPSGDSTKILSRSYTVTFDANGGVRAPGSVTKAVGVEFSIPGIDPRPFYTFLGWADTPTAVVPQYYPYKTATFCKDTTLYAVWNGPHNETGRCGDNLTWTLTPEGALTITGTGEMDPGPHWNNYRTLIKTVVIDEGATSIGRRAFINCCNIESVSLPTTLKRIADEAFRDCCGIESLSLPASLESIGEDAFRDCDGIPSVTVPAGVTHIGVSAFRDNDGLSSVIISEGVQTVGELAFYNSCYIKTLYIPHSVTSIGSDALASTSGCDVYYNGTTAEWAAIAGSSSCRGTMHFTDGLISGICGENLIFTLDSNGVLTILGTGRMYNFTDDYTPWHNSKAEIKSVVITSGVESIGNSAFVSCAALASVSLPTSLTEIGSAAFRYCSALTKLDIPTAVGSIGSEALANSGLTEFTIPSGIASVNASAFANCASLAKVTIPDTVTSVAEYAFYGCTALTDVYYSHTRAKWNTITKAAQNAPLTAATLHCSKFTVTFSANGSTVVPDAQIKSIGSPLTLSAAIPEHTGCIFLGWSSSASASAVDYQPGGTYTADADITLYAVWNYLLDVSLVNYTEGQEIWSDGRKCSIVTLKGKDYAVLPTTAEKYLTVYTLNDPTLTDVHLQYPVAMKVYKLNFDSELCEYSATEIPKLENLLTYSGTSIRYTGNKGIRSITSVNEALREQLIKGYAGYTLEEYGTVMCWAYNIVDGSVALDDSYAASASAYKKGSADPIFKRENGVIQYTNVLLVPTLEKCKDDVAMRPYVILTDSDGQRVIVYGGVIYRSVGYVAYQNRNALTPGTDGYKFIWEIIHAVYGTKYDKDYKEK